MPPSRQPSPGVRAPSPAPFFYPAATDSLAASANSRERQQLLRGTSTSSGGLRRSASSPFMLHSKERCPSCGVWKDKSGNCYHCTYLPNRLQAQEAQERHEPANLTPIGFGIGDTRRGYAVVLAKDIFSRAVCSTEPSAVHTKERCKSCGLWKDKTRDCVHCVTRPNRVQARLAIERGHETNVLERGVELDPHIARIQTATGYGSPQRPLSAPANSAISSDSALLFRATAAPPGARPTVRRARGPSSYIESGLYRDTKHPSRKAHPMRPSRAPEGRWPKHSFYMQ